MALHLEWLAHAAIHANPGVTFQGCDRFRILNGIFLEEHSPSTIQVLTSRGTRVQDSTSVPVIIRSVGHDGRETGHSQAEILVSRGALPGEIVTTPTQFPPYPHSIETIYDEMLFHGPELQGIQRVEGISDRAIVAWIRSAPPPSRWMQSPLRGAWLADPMVLDGAFQMMILWTLAQHGMGSLPLYIGQYRQFRRGYPRGEVKVTGWVTQVANALVRADFDIVDQAGVVIAFIKDYECVMMPSLQEAFRRNQLSVTINS
jgi:hypothetical protein